MYRKQLLANMYGIQGAILKTSIPFNQSFLSQCCGCTENKICRVLFWIYSRLFTILFPYVGSPIPLKSKKHLCAISVIWNAVAKILPYGCINFGLKTTICREFLFNNPIGLRWGGRGVAFCNVLSEFRASNAIWSIELDEWLKPVILDQQVCTYVLLNIWNFWI